VSESAPLRHPMKTARGLGSAKSGVHHWLAQRVSAVALAPLSVWFVWHATWLFSADHIAAEAFVSMPQNAVLLAVFAVTLLYHSYLGLQVIVEDYVHAEFTKLATLVLLKFAHVGLAVVAVFVLLEMAL
jgi:succinate dehydrogenase / fumarate reductase membrane anchor subunit